MKKAKNRGMVSGRWWALLRGPNALPVLFGSKDDARDNRDFDEYLVEVHVRPMQLGDLVRGERTMVERLRAEGKRPRVPVEHKRRRGSAITLAGASLLASELKKMAPLMRQRFVDAMNGELKAGRDGKLKFREVKRAAAPRVRR